MLLSRCRMFRQTKFAVPSKFFPVAFADCSSNLDPCRHFISLMSLFQRHVALRNLPYQGLSAKNQTVLHKIHYNSAQECFFIHFTLSKSPFHVSIKITVISLSVTVDTYQYVSPIHTSAPRHLYS